MKIIFFFLSILVSLFVYSQTSKQWYKQGRKAFLAENYSTAAYYFSRALEQEQNPGLAWYYAESCRKIHEYEQAEKWYLYVYQHAEKKYPLASFWLGVVQKMQGKYQRAQISFKNYLKNNTLKNDYFTQKARHEVLSCENALFLTFDSIPKNILFFDSTINSPYSEFVAAIDNDSIFWVTSFRPLEHEDSVLFNSKLLHFKKTNNRTKLLPIDSTFNKPDWFVSSFCFMNHQRSIILSICQNTQQKKYQCKLYRSHKNRYNWTPIEPLSELVNEENSSTTTPFVVETDTARYLLFASNRKGSYGNYDIWAVAIDSLANPTGIVFNLGKNVNSIDNEISPYYDIKEKAFYFSSEWFTNLGGYDIFVSHGWINQLLPPQNMGFPLNTNNNEVFFKKLENESYYIFSSNRSYNTTNSTEKCCNDFYVIPIEQPKKDSTILVAEKEHIKKRSTELIPIYLYFHNDEPNPKTWDTTTQHSYDQLYEKYIDMREEYIRIYSNKLKEEEKNIAATEIDNFFTEEVQKNYLKLLNFLSMLKQLLEKGDTIAITIKGFASPLNNNAYNLNLSKRRVNSFIKMLYKYDNGFFVPYIENKSNTKGKLIIKREAYGENMVSPNVSDDPNDIRNSIYSPKAAFERKIAIIAVEFSK